jgi:hypothetical protein
VERHVIHPTGGGQAVQHGFDLLCQRFRRRTEVRIDELDVAAAETDDAGDLARVAEGECEAATEPGADR